jgi:hypothetical protein
MLTQRSFEYHQMMIFWFFFLCIYAFVCGCFLLFTALVPVAQFATAGVPVLAGIFAGIFLCTIAKEYLRMQELAGEVVYYIHTELDPDVQQHLLGSLSPVAHCLENLGPLQKPLEYVTLRIFPEFRLT